MKRHLKTGDIFSTRKTFGKIKKHQFYVVVSTRMSGDGKCHNDTFPDAHTVTVHEFDKHGGPNGTAGKKAVEFYQSHCYSGSIMPEDIIFCAKVKVTPTYTLDSLKLVGEASR